VTLNPLILIFPLAMAFAAAMDLFTMTIPNRVSVILIATFAIIAVSAGTTWSVVGNHLMVTGAVFVAAITMYAMGWMGGGDAKLLTAASLWLGPDLFPGYLLLVSMYGGMLAFALLYFRGITLLPKWLNQQRWALRLHDSNGGIPYGVALGAAALVVYPKTSWFLALAITH
jgi:prepilin peptidase CpaA